MNPIRSEPLVTVAGITALASAIIALLVVYGVDMNEDQQTAWMTVIAIVAPLVVGVIARLKVSPSWKVGAAPTPPATPEGD